MPIVEVTPTLAEVIKSERKKRNIRGDNLSKDLGKTNTFISQIETRKIKEIDSKLFYEIFRNIIDKEIYDSFMNNLTSNTDNFKLKYSVDEIESEKWYLSFQERYCQIPIPQSIIDFINSKLVQLNITSSDLVDYINKNETLNNKNEYNDNEYVVDMDEDGLRSISIKFNFQENIVQKIINYEITSICYIFMLGIIFHLYLKEGKNEYDSKTLAHKFLRDNDFITPGEREVLVQEKMINLNLPEYDISDLYDNVYYKEYEKFVSEIKRHYDMYRSVTVEQANTYLKQHIDNLKNNPQLTMAILGFPLSKIDKIKQKDYFNEIKVITNKYMS